MADNMNVQQETDATEKRMSLKRARRLGELANQGIAGKQERAKHLVFSYAINHLDVTDERPFTIDEVYVVWFCSVLQNWKALLSTTLPDGMYYEVTFNGDKDEAYLDAYKKFDNLKVSYGEDALKDVNAKSQYV